DNLSGDIPSALGAALTGGLGLAPSGNINPDRTGPSVFEPVHGSAPDIAGTGLARPAGAVLSAAVMTGRLGNPAGRGSWRRTRSGRNKPRKGRVHHTPPGDRSQQVGLDLTVADKLH